MRARRRAVSPITRRILAVNVLAQATLVAGLLYLGEYRRGLIEAELVSLAVQAEMFAVALGEGAVAAESNSAEELLPESARHIVRRLSATTGARARLFAADGKLVVDSSLLVGPGGGVEIEELPPPIAGDPMRWLLDLSERIGRWLPGGGEFPPYAESATPTGEDYSEVLEALIGESASRVRSRASGELVLSAAVPVQRYKQILGAIMLSRGGAALELAVLEVRVGILEVFLVALAITVLLSIYLAGTIARPVRRLALAAERVRRGLSRRYAIPDLGRREDEIGDLAGSLRDMTAALWQRMDAIERFAADVAHEIKNPLSSLRSAVETASRVANPEQRQRLMAIILDDVERMDRLITEIAEASRLDAEMSRAEPAPVDVGELLATLAAVHAATAAAEAPVLRVEAPADTPLVVNGVEGRIVQVVRNLIANAISFSPPRGRIVLRGAHDDGWVRIEVDDQGPGLPAGKEEAIFERFYSQRPAGEKFGTHSGLGLSISKQIVEAHGGTIVAETLRRPDGGTVGSRFTVRLPARDEA